MQVWAVAHCVQIELLDSRNNAPWPKYSCTLAHDRRKIFLQVRLGAYSCVPYGKSSMYLRVAPQRPTSRVPVHIIYYVYDILYILMICYDILMIETSAICMLNVIWCLFVDDYMLWVL